MKPLPLTAEMALAAILGPKTETRRPVRLGKNKSALEFDRRCKAIGVREALAEFGHHGPHLPAPFGLPGDWCWLREPGRIADLAYSDESVPLLTIEYLADKARRVVSLPDRLGVEELGRDPSWLKVGHGIPNGIFREAARFKALILEVRVERLQEITEAGALAEGIQPWQYTYLPGQHPHKGLCRNCGQVRGSHVGSNRVCFGGMGTTFNTSSARGGYAVLWDRIYGKRPGLAWADAPWVSVTKFKPLEAI